MPVHIFYYMAERKARSLQIEEFARLAAERGIQVQALPIQQLPVPRKEDTTLVLTKFTHELVHEDQDQSIQSKIRSFEV